MATSSAIDVNGLGRDYGSTRALDRLDLIVPPGTLLGLLGPNGAGKSTTLLILATLLRPSRGSARLLGLDLARQAGAVRERLGLVFQDPTIDPLLTVEENLRFAARLAGLGGAAVSQAVNRAIERVGLGPHRHRRARQLSGGWRRLTDIARATLHRPDLLLLDEPTVGLDPEHRDRFWSVLDGERREHGVTVLFSTHYMAEAEAADRVVLLGHGVAVADGVPRELRQAMGEAVAEFEGPAAADFEARLRQEGLVVTTVRTGRGWRVGVREAGRVTRLLSEFPGRLSRLGLREPSLEDVYFLRTQ
jgi:ABC-2 type transport system ATP-binding protein